MWEAEAKDQMKKNGCKIEAEIEEDNDKTKKIFLYP